MSIADCDSFTYTLTNYDNTPADMTFFGIDSTNRIFSIYTTDKNKKLSYHLKVIGNHPYYGSIFFDVYVTLIKLCEDMVLTTYNPNSNIIYDVHTDEVITSFDPWQTDLPNCGTIMTYSAELSNGDNLPEAIEFDVGRR